jgi:hypothetical protein
MKNKEGPSTLRPSLKPDTRSCDSTGNSQVRGCSGHNWPGDVPRVGYKSAQCAHTGAMLTTKQGPYQEP